VIIPPHLDISNTERTKGLFGKRGVFVANKDGFYTFYSWSYIGDQTLVFGLGLGLESLELAGYFPKAKT